LRNRFERERLVLAVMTGVTLAVYVAAALFVGVTLGTFLK
jgi:hypothetical protein